MLYKYDAKLEIVLSSAFILNLQLKNNLLLILILLFIF
jgi:hypothetical protein